MIKKHLAARQPCPRWGTEDQCWHSNDEPLENGVESEIIDETLDSVLTRIQTSIQTQTQTQDQSQPVAAQAQKQTRPDAIPSIVISRTTTPVDLVASAEPSSVCRTMKEQEEATTTILNEIMFTSSNTTTPSIDDKTTLSTLHTSSSLTSTLVLSLPPTTAAGGNNNTNSQPRKPAMNIGYAAIAPVLFVILALTAIYMWKKQKGKRVAKAAGNLRRGGVVDGEEERRELETGGVPIIAVPAPPPRREKNTGSRVGENKEGVEMQRLGSTANPNSDSETTAAAISGAEGLREGQRDLRDSDIYSPRFATPSQHTSCSSNNTPIVELLPSIELEDLDGRTISPQTALPILPPLPSPDSDGNWLPSTMNSPARTLPPRKKSPPQTPPGPTQGASPPISGPSIALIPSQQNSTATPFHRNYRRISDAPTTITTRTETLYSNMSCSTITTQEASQMVMKRVEEVAEVEAGRIKRQDEKDGEK